jgi:hypothetical protein
VNGGEILAKFLGRAKSAGKSKGNRLKYPVVEQGEVFRTLKGQLIDAALLGSKILGKQG